MFNSEYSKMYSNLFIDMDESLHSIIINVEITSCKIPWERLNDFPFS